MEKSRLSSAEILAWLDCLPEDVRDAVTGKKEIEDSADKGVFRMEEVVDPSLDEPARALEAAVFAVLQKSDDEIVAVLDAHEGTLVGMGRPRRMRLVSILFDTPWPMPVDIGRRIVASKDADDEGEGDTGRSGRAREYPPILRSDIEQYAKVATSRIVRAASATSTVAAISSGIRSSDTSAGMNQPGGMG